jgi:hypothetical protein
MQLAQIEIFCPPLHVTSTVVAKNDHGLLKAE